MADQVEPQTKTIQGSAEWRRQRVDEAIRAEEFFGRNDSGYRMSTWVSDSFEDFVVAEVWTGDVTEQYRVAYTIDDGGVVTLGERQKVAKVEVLVEVPEAAEASEAVPALPALNSASWAWRPDEKKSLDTGARGANGQCRWVLPLNFKAITGNDSDGWTFEGYLSVFNVVDAGRDIVRKGAFERTLKERPNVKLMSEHSELTGTMLEGKEDDYGLFTKWHILPTRRGTDDYILLKGGALDSLSQGWLPNMTNPKAMKKNADGTRDLLDIDLFEGSLVAFPMLGVARVTEVKSADELASMPTTDLLAFAGQTVHEAVYGAGGLRSLYLRRLEDGRTVTDDQWEAATSLGLKGLDSAVELLGIEAKAGRALSRERQKLVRAAVAALAKLVDSSIGEWETDDDDGAGGDKPKAKAAGVLNSSRAEAHRALHLEFLKRRAAQSAALAKALEV